MPVGVTTVLRELERRKSEFGGVAGQRKLELLKILEKRRLPRAADVLRLHEVLCFLRAYPDDAELLVRVERMLDGFTDRGDLRRHRAALLNSGIAGTTTCHSFYPATACWLARRWGPCLTIVWDDFQRQERLEQILPQFALYCETPGLDECTFKLREWIERLKAPGETDATFLLRRFEQLPMSPFVREILLEDLDLPLQLSPGPDTPSRTREKYSGSVVVFPSGPLQRSRPSVKNMIRRPPLSIRETTPRKAQALIDLARSAMASRGRELEAFVYADRNDVRMVDCGNGLQFAYMGVTPERRFLLESLYGFVMLKNGVVVGYGSNVGLFGSSEIAFTVFDTYRGTEAARMYGHTVAIARHVFKADTIVVDPYQLGEENDDAIRSGAWWFYQGLGFRPREVDLNRLMRRELSRTSAKPSYRSSEKTLKKLASSNLFLDLKKRREDVLGGMPLGNVGLHITRYLAENFGHDRRQASKVCSQKAAALLGVRSFRNFTSGERLAWRRWSPLILALPGIERWPRLDKRTLVAVVRAKGGRRESDYLLRFDRHRRLRRAICTLAQSR